MTFANPLYLALLAAVPLVAVLLFGAARRRRSALALIGNPDLVDRLTAGVNARGRIVRQALFVAALTLAIVALSRPQWGESRQIVERRGVQLMVAMDVSKSMLAEDLKPNRLSRAKIAIADLMQRLTGDEVGLLVFSSQTFVQFPMTYDYATARTFLENASPNMVSVQGTSIAKAIEVASGGFDEDRPNQKAIVIVSDGEDHEGGAVEAARTAAEAGIVVYTVGIGFAEGAPIPIRDDFGVLAGYEQDRRGNMVLSRVDEDALRQIAEAGNGRYFRESGAGGSAAGIAHSLSELESAVSESEVRKKRVERFQLFTIAAIALLFAGGLIADRRRDARRGRPWRRPA